MVGTDIIYVFLFLSLYFEVFLLLAFLQDHAQSAVPVPVASDQDLPRVAVVVPCFNERKSLHETLASLLALDYPQDKLEILVVDDGSTDDTALIAETFAHDSRVRVYSKDNGGKHTAMNFALERTDAEFIGCLDADSVVEPGALREMIPAFAAPAVAAVIPGIHVRDPRTILQHIQHVEYRLSIFHRFAFSLLGSIFITPGPFSFFRTKVVRKLGGWVHGHSTEDMEMALRMQAAGYAIVNIPEAVVHTSTPATLRGLFRQRVRWTYGWLRNALDYRFMIGNHRYGNLGLLILPSALISIVAGIYLFIYVLLDLLQTLTHNIVRVQATGNVLPTMSLGALNLQMSGALFITVVSIVIVFILICAGSFIGTGSRKPPTFTPVFLIAYGFLVPLWLCVAVVRAVFKTGVPWR